jgi:Contractile injection system tube protein
MADSTLNARPERVSITNIETGDVLEVQFNPDEVNEKVGAAYNDLAILGLSHKPDQFQNTENLAINIDLPFDALCVDGGVETIGRARKFLHHLAYPVDGQDVRTGGTPRAMFLWPGLYAITGRLRSVDITMKRFNRDMALTYFVAKVALTESRTSRITSAEVLDFGTVRS